MPIFYPHPILLSSRRSLLLVAAALGLACAMPQAQGQTLARPGWAGSGMTANVWWKHAFVYAIDLQDPQWANGLKGVTARMDAMQTLGADAVLLQGLQSGPTAGINPSVGTMDDFDEVQQQASRHSLRVLVELAPQPGEDVTDVARFWLSRGVAGFRLKSTPGESGAQMRQVRTAAKNFVGERVILGDASQGGAANGKGYDGPQLLVDASIAVAPLNVAAIRSALEKNDAMNRPGSGVPILATADGAGGGAELGKAVATLLLSSRGGTMIRAGQEGSGEESLAQWYRQSSSLEHSNATVRTGATSVLNHDSEGVVAWMRRPQVVSYHSPAVVFLCNMTDKTVTLSLVDDMQRLKLKGLFLKTLLRSDVGMGAMKLGTVTLAPYGVYVGELSY